MHDAGACFAKPSRVQRERARCLRKADSLRVLYFMCGARKQEAMLVEDTMKAAKVLQRRRPSPTRRWRNLHFFHRLRGFEAMSPQVSACLPPARRVRRELQSKTLVQLSNGTGLATLRLTSGGACENEPDEHEKSQRNIMPAARCTTQRPRILVTRLLLSCPWS